MDAAFDVSILDLVIKSFKNSFYEARRKWFAGNIVDFIELKMKKLQN